MYNCDVLFHAFVCLIGLNVYAKYVYMHCYLQRNVTVKKEMFSYFLYVVILTIMLWIYPKITFLWRGHLVVSIALTTLYKDHIKRKIWVIVLVSVLYLFISYLTCLCLNIFVLNFSSAKRQLFEVFCINIVFLLIIRNMTLIHCYRKKKEITYMELAMNVCVPVGTLYLFYIIIQQNSLNYCQMGYCVFVLTIFNVVIFILFDKVKGFCKEKLELVAVREQRESYQNQLKLLQELQENAKIVRHDLKNHLFALKAMITKESKKEAIGYIDEVRDYIENKFRLSNSGNLTIDSIINYKLGVAVQNQIEVDLVINIPVELKIEPIDVTTIIGNLLDNAIEAATKVEGKRWLHIEIGYDRNIITIMISNTYNGSIRVVHSNLVSTKEDVLLHGIGIRSVKKSVQKYHGDFVYSYNKEVFQVNVVLYNS